ncbi:uncharacterized protein EV422DRAFT_153947 [Fimicolochytrium jonesii]|uniref:uncharacterized protein n=1 Tax=Fimicolochytrium jonesii TaxID=1396493 RepID=UPI0022FF2AD7|nr:uncharacterized protein EV422DRAFT_153947 [Fimicolochytrium jonesii]KAI8826105.1 hypothetical protein EV422DRAFT_153947 [Fimicolochytrium jonesii]
MCCCCLVYEINCGYLSISPPFSELPLRNARPGLPTLPTHCKPAKNRREKKSTKEPPNMAANLTQAGGRAASQPSVFEATPTWRLFHAHHKILRALASAIIRKHHDFTSTGGASSIAGRSAFSSIGYAALPSAAQRAAYLRAMSTGAALSNNHGDLAAYVALTAGDLARLMAGKGSSSEMLACGARAGGQYGKELAVSSVAHFGKEGLLRALQRTLLAIIALSKEFLANPWVDISVVAAALSALSWLYVRRLPNSSRSAQADFDEALRVAALNDPTNPDGILFNEPPETPVPIPSIPDPTPQEAYISQLESQNRSMNDQLQKLSARATQLAEALERSINHVTDVETRLGYQGNVIERLEEENRTLRTRLEEILTASMHSELRVPSVVSRSSAGSVASVPPSPSLSSSDSYEWVQLPEASLT